MLNVKPQKSVFLSLNQKQTNIFIKKKDTAVRFKHFQRFQGPSTNPRRWQLAHHCLEYKVVVDGTRFQSWYRRWWSIHLQCSPAHTRRSAGFLVEKIPGLPPSGSAGLRAARRAAAHNLGTKSDEEDQCKEAWRWDESPLPPAPLRTRDHPMLTKSKTQRPTSGKAEFWTTF